MTAELCLKQRRGFSVVPVTPFISHGLLGWRGHVVYMASIGCIRAYEDQSNFALFYFL